MLIISKENKIDKQIHDITLAYLATENFQNYGSEENKRNEFLKHYKDVYKFFKKKLDTDDI